MPRRTTYFQHLMAYVIIDISTSEKKKEFMCIRMGEIREHRELTMLLDFFSQLVYSSWSQQHPYRCRWLQFLFMGVNITDCPASYFIYTCTWVFKTRLTKESPAGGGVVVHFYRGTRFMLRRRTTIRLFMFRNAASKTITSFTECLSAFTPQVPHLLPGACLFHDDLDALIGSPVFFLLFIFLSTQLICFTVTGCQAGNILFQSPMISLPITYSPYLQQCTVELQDSVSISRCQSSI